MEINTTALNSKKALALIIFTTGVLLAGMAMADPTPPPTSGGQTRSMVITSTSSDNEDSAPSPSPGGKASSRNVIRIESIASSLEEESDRVVTWLGVSTEEVSEVLAAQLGLKSGQGLVVVFVAPNSPAAKAGIQKYDVLDEFGDQMLVGPEQLRKLVQMQKEGDTIKLTLHRAGKKQTVSATLGKRNGNLSMGSGMGMSNGQHAFAFSTGAKNINWVQNDQDAPMAVVQVDKQMVDAEVQRNVDEARKEIQEALRQSAQASRQAALVVPGMPAMPPLPPRVAIVNDATVTVTKDDASVKTVVKSDESGILVIVASPKKYLTVHDQNGKLLFDGPIESPEEQKKVPAQLWEKVKPLLEQIKPVENDEPEPHAQSDGDKNSETKPEAGVLVSL